MEGKVLHKRKNEPILSKAEKDSRRLAEEKFLEKLVFGSRGDVISQIDKGVNVVSVDLTRDVRGEQELENQLFVVDVDGDEGLVSSEGEDDTPQPETKRANFSRAFKGFDSDDDEDNREIEQQFARAHGEEDEDADDNQKRPAWNDEDDDVDVAEVFGEMNDKYPKKVLPDQKFKDYLESNFTTVHQTPTWAQKKDKKDSDDSDEYDSDDDRLERTARDFKKPKQSGVLDKEFLHVMKCIALNQSSKITTSLNSVNFHPKSMIALLGSQTGLVRVFQVDGKVNPLLQSIYFRGFRMSDAKFISSNGREEIIVGSDGSQKNSLGFCFYYDMIAGKIVRVKLSKGACKPYSLRNLQVSPDCQYIAGCDQKGMINILSAKSKEHIAEFVGSIDVDCLTFSEDSNYLFAHGRNSAGQAYVWDMRNLKSASNPCINRFMDVGTVEGTCIASSQDLFAVGSNMGVVNVYKMADVVRQSQPDPVKTVLNLTTAITSMKFNHDGQLLMIASGDQNDSLRIMNTRYGTVYKNFPSFVGGTTGKTYGRVYDIDFSPHSGYMSWATGNGTGHLYKILEYPTY